MTKSKVFFTDMRAVPGNNLINKLEKLVKKAGMLDMEFEKKFTAIKIHFGEPGNMSYLRPDYAALIARLVAEKGGFPFLTDSSTLYSGRRSNALDHLKAAAEHGYTPYAVGCQIIIADGLKGTDERVIEINQKHCKTAKIGSAIADADVLISINHFKGHEITGFGGALKNIGMGSGSKGGKMEMHCGSKPKIHADNCIGCNICGRNCAMKAITMEEKKARINYEVCTGCGQCIAMCQYDAAQADWEGDASVGNACERMVEYTYAVLKDRPAFHVNLVMDVSPNCDCWSMNDLPIVPNIGMLASFDPVALDMACANLVNQSEPITKSQLIDKCSHYCTGHDKFSTIYPHTSWSNMLAYAEEIGLGSRDYELINL
ncbi:MAG: DUF362 domain-containing protein [Clostridia bacterium]|nr:DUF362 domain-containing protein [Clostridia bacterium]